MAPPRSIAIIFGTAVPAAAFRGDLITTLAERGIRVYALAPDYSDDLRTRIARFGAVPISFPMDPTGMNPVKDGWDLLRLARILRRLQPDTVLNCFTKPVVYGTLAATLARVPSRYAMIEGLGFLFSRDRPSKGILSGVISRLFQLAFTCADKIFFLNSDDPKYFLDRGLIDPAKIVQIGGIGVDLLHYHRRADPPATPSFLLAARLLREKGVYDFIEAARMVRRQAPDARFTVLGDLDGRKGAVRRHEIDGWVAEGLIEWPGHVSDVRPWLDRAGVFVLPSFYGEGVPRSTQEAMAMGCAVITTDNVGCRDTVEHGRNGFLIPVQNPAALAEAMQRFIDHPRLIAQMGQASRQIAEDRFDVHRVNDAIMRTMGIHHG